MEQKWIIEYTNWIWSIYKKWNGSTPGNTRGQWSTNGKWNINEQEFEAQIELETFHELDSRSTPSMTSRSIVSMVE